MLHVKLEQVLLLIQTFVYKKEEKIDNLFFLLTKV